MLWKMGLKQKNRIVWLQSDFSTLVYNSCPPIYQKHASQNIEHFFGSFIGLVSLKKMPVNEITGNK